MTDKDKVVSCDETCKTASREVEAESTRLAEKKEKEEDSKNRREAELFERRMEGGGKKRRRNRKTESLEETSSLWTRQKVPIVVCVSVAVVSVVLFFIIGQ